MMQGLACADAGNIMQRTTLPAQDKQQPSRLHSHSGSALPWYTQGSAGLGLQVGFFCTAGPLKMFVSTHLIPEEFEYSTEDEPSFVSSDEEVRIKAGSEVRVRIVGVRLDANECVRPRSDAVNGG